MTAKTSAAIRAVVPVFALTLLLSAFLLFLIQPLFGKMILPLLGGSPSVWNTAMLFFQVLLLAGYAYAHGTARFLNMRTQAVVHFVLLAVFIFVLPIAIPEGWVPPTGKDPTLWQLGLMAVAVGGPFFVLSGSAPMLQHWFAHTDHPDADNPYFLYAASNLGSMTALIAYPFIVEPALKISEQSLGWSFGYGLLIVFVMLSALLALRHSKPGISIARESHDTEIITNQRRLLWLALAFVPSSLMLGVTTFIATDLASAPLLWIVPLALYVSTFIIAFAKKPIPSRNLTLTIQAFFLILLMTIEICLIPLDKAFLISTHILLFFFTALMCHHELAASRPHARHLTQFYLIMSLGGALGGFFNAIIAPNVFVTALEYGLVLAFSAFVRYSSEDRAGFKVCLERLRASMRSGIPAFIKTSGLPFIVITLVMSLSSHHLLSMPKLLIIIGLVTLLMLPLLIRRRWVLGFCALAVLIIHAPGQNLDKLFVKETHYRDRNFFGILKVGDVDDGIRLLLHGTTIHGAQAIDPAHKLVQISYYSRFSPLTDAFAMADNMSMPQKVGVLGLGIGVAACYRKEGRSFDFFEIDPAVVKVAEDPSLFTYLSDCGSPYEIVLGDGRLKIAEKPDGYYDVILLDVFSSDNIPIHVITFEAMMLYKKKLKDNGFIVLNTSNRYMDLLPVTAAAAKAMDMKVFSKFAGGGKMEDSGIPYSAAEFVVFTNNPLHMAYLKEKGWTEPAQSPDVHLWTDQFSDIVSVLKVFK